MLAQMAIAAALASPILGDGPHNKGTAVLKPANLRVAKALPRTTTQVDVAPDGRRLAVAEQTTIGRPYHAFLEVLDGTETTARVKVDLLHRVVSWLADDRIMLVQRSKPVRVQVIAPSQGKVIHAEAIPERFGDTARVGEHQVVLTSPARGGEQSLSVFSSGGVLEHKVPLPDMVDGTLHGRSPIADTALAYSDAKRVVYAVNVLTGEAVRHDVTIPSGYATWVEPQTGDMLALGAYDDVSILDPATFAVRRTVHPGSLVKGAGDGFLSVADEGDAPLKVYDGEGNLRWKRKLDTLDASAFGDRVYAGSGYDDVRIRVLDLATGKVRRVLKGRAYLFEASQGRVDPPYFTNQKIVED